MRILIKAQSFTRALKRRCKNRSQLQAKVLATLSMLEKDPFDPSLKTHRLQGDLKEFWSCSVEYDFRIVFQFCEIPGEAAAAIILIDVGTHDEVY